MLKFLKVMNILYNENSAIKEATYLSTVFPKIQIQKILVDLNLPFNLRIEILKFFRIAYINMKIDILKLQEYISIVINSESNSSDYAQSSFNFFHNLLNVKDTDSNMVIESYVLTYELKNFSKIVEEVNVDMFFDERNKLIFNAIKSLYEDNVKILI